MKNQLFCPKSFCLFIICTIFSTVRLSAQCNVNAFTAVKTNGTCFANGSIAVQVPGGVTCTGWTAILTPPSGVQQSLSLPANGGPVSFAGLAAGSYSVRLFNGITTVQAANNPIAVTTSYVNMVTTASHTNPSCATSTAGYTTNGTLTITKTSGGVGPYVYTMTSSLGTQTSGSTSATSFTFTGLPGNETVTYSIQDLVASQAGCEVTQFSTRVIGQGVSSTFSNFQYRMVRNCTPNCTSV